MGGSFATWVTAVAAVGEGCTSAAWVAAVFAGFGRLAGFLPHAGQRSVWGKDPDVRLVGAVAPSGRATPVPGGWLLTGTWRYVSGAAFSDWALLAGHVPDEGAGHVRFFAVPREGYDVTAAWSAAGMRGTGSDTVGVDEAYVAEELSFPGRLAADGGPPARHRPAVPSGAVTPLGFVAPALGAATGALTAWAERLGGAADAGKEPSDAVRVALARSTAEVDAARLLVDRAAATADRGCAAPADAVRNARDAALAMDLVVTAVSRQYRLLGTGGQSEPRFQRPWRDITTAAGHAVLAFEAAGRAYADESITSRRAPHVVRRDTRSHRA
ncbi:actinorhodin polyketide dimerase ActVA [Streptomyces nogalater]